MMVNYGWWWWMMVNLTGAFYFFGNDPRKITSNVIIPATSSPIQQPYVQRTSKLLGDFLEQPWTFWRSSNLPNWGEMRWVKSREDLAIFHHLGEQEKLWRWWEMMNQHVIMGWDIIRRWLKRHQLWINSIFKRQNRDLNRRKLREISGFFFWEFVGPKITDKSHNNP